MILSHADSERRSVEGLRQDIERWIHPLKCLGWRLIGHHTVYLSLQESLDGIGTLVVPFHLGAISFLSNSVASPSLVVPSCTPITAPFRSAFVFNCFRVSEDSEPHAARNRQRSIAQKLSRRHLKFLYFIISVSTYNCFIYSAHISAHLSPSTPADTIPPAYPAPSPHGKSPWMRTCCRVSLSRMMRTGDEVLVSIAIRVASLVRKPCAFLPKVLKPSCRRLLTNEGIQKCSGLLMIPGA